MHCTAVPMTSGHASGLDPVAPAKSTMMRRRLIEQFGLASGLPHPATWKARRRGF